jgi:hypothetical protein
MAHRVHFSRPIVNSVCRPLDLNSEEGFHAFNLDRYQFRCVLCSFFHGVFCSRAIDYTRLLRGCIQGQYPVALQIEFPSSFQVIQSVRCELQTGFEEAYDRYNRPLSRRAARSRIIINLK